MKFKFLLNQSRLFEKLLKKSLHSTLNIIKIHLNKEGLYLIKYKYIKFKIVEKEIIFLYNNLSCKKEGNL